MSEQNQGKPTPSATEVATAEETRTALGQEFIQRSVDRAIAESHVDARFGSWDPVTGRLDTPSGVRG